MRGETISGTRSEPSPRTLYLLYHELSSLPVSYAYALEARIFEGHADLFLRAQNASHAGLQPEITFDDGHISNYEYALPILASRNMKASFFITVGWTGKKPGFMGWAELKAIHASGQSIGAHGWSHVFLTRCSPVELDRELIRARCVLEDKLGASVTTMSLPGGRFDRRVLAACRQAGYTKVFSSVPRAEPEPSGFTVGRLNIRTGITLELVAKLLQPGGNALSALERQYRIKAAARTLLGDRLYARLWALLNRKEPDTDQEEAVAVEDSADNQ